MQYKPLEPLPCPNCQIPVMVKYMAGCDRNMATRIHHPYNGMAVFYIRCDCCGLEMSEGITGASKAAQSKNRYFLTVRWNKQAEKGGQNG